MNSEGEDGGLTFNDDEWKAVFGAEDDDEKPEKTLNQEDESGDKDDTAPVASPSVNAAHSSASTAAAGKADVRTTDAASKTVQLEEGAVDLSSFDVMDLCMKHREKLRAEGNTREADALAAVGFTLINMMAKVVNLEQRNERIHFGSLLMEAVQSLMNDGPEKKALSLMYRLLFCIDSIRALVDEVRQKISSGSMKQQTETEVEVIENGKTKTKEFAAKLADERRKRRMEAAYARNRLEADEKRRRRENERGEIRSIFRPLSPQSAERRLETSNNASNRNAVLLAANKFANRQKEQQKQMGQNTSLNEQHGSLSNSNTSSNAPVMPNSPDDGPINAEDLMEDAESDSNSSAVLPSFPVQQRQRNVHYQSLRPHVISLSTRGIRGRFRGQRQHRLVRSDLPSLREPAGDGGGGGDSALGQQQPRLATAQSTAPAATFIESSGSNLNCRPNAGSSSSPASGSSRPVVAQSKTGAQKYAGLEFALVRKANTQGNSNSGTITQPPNTKKVTFVPEELFLVRELPDNPNTTREILNTVVFPEYRLKYPQGSAFMPEDEERRRRRDQLCLPPREYNFFLGPTTTRPIGSVNARSFRESCEFSRAEFRNWLIVGSRFDRLNEEIFALKKHGCPKTHLTRANYPPIHFRMLCDALGAVNTNIAGLNIFLVIGEDWIVKQSINPEEFTAFIPTFADVLFRLYAQQYEAEIKKLLEFTDDSDKVTRGFAYLEMPTIVLLTIPQISDPQADARCSVFNDSIRSLVRRWDFSMESPYYHASTKQCIGMKLIDWKKMCTAAKAVSIADTITILMKHLMEEWGICVVPANR